MNSTKDFAGHPGLGVDEHREQRDENICDGVDDPQDVKGEPRLRKAGKVQRDQRDRARDHKERLQEEAEPEQPEADAAEAVTTMRPEPQVPVLAGDLDIAAGPAQPLLPQPVDLVRLFRPYDGVRLEDHPVPGQLRPERGEGVLGQRGCVDPAAHGDQVLARVQLGAPGQAGGRAQDVLAAPRGRLGGDVLVADEPGEVVAGPGAFLDVGGDGTDLRIGEVPGHGAERRRLIDDVGIHDQQRLHPVVGQADLQPVVQRVRLAVAALLPAQVDHVARVLRRLGQHHVGCVVRARVVHDEDAQRVPRVVEQHEPVDGCADDGGLVPRRDHDGGPGEVRLAGAVVIAPEMDRDEQELVGGGQLGHGSGHDKDNEQPLPAENQVMTHLLTPWAQRPRYA